MATPAATVTTSTSTVRVRYAETDRMGVTYYANYFVWFEVARADLLRSRGWTYREMEDAGVRLPVIEARCEYLRSTGYDEALTVRTEARVISPVRLEFRYEVCREDGTVAARGTTLHAAVDLTGKPCRLPARVREALA